MRLKGSKGYFAFTAFSAVLILGVTWGISITAGAVNTPATPSDTGTAPVLPGQVVHSVVRAYERRASDDPGGPPHLDRAALFPETVVSETWVVAGDNDQIRRAVTFRRDPSGKLLEVTVVNDKGEIFSFDARFNQTTATKLNAPGRVSQTGARATTLQRTLAANTRATRGSGSVGNEPTTIVEVSRFAAADLAPQAANASQRGGLSVADLSAREIARRLEFSTQTGRLRKDVTYAIDAVGKETAVKSENWEIVETRDGTQVPTDALNPMLPTAFPTAFTPVPLQQFSLASAKTSVPFALYLPSSWNQDPAKTSIGYGAGKRVDGATLPLAFQGLDFAVARGDAAQVTRSGDQQSRPVTIMQGRSDDFAESLRRGLPFWSRAEPVAVTISGRSLSGWYMTSTPVVVTTNPSASDGREVSGPVYLLLPDAGGAAILMTASGYSKNELLALAATLQPLA